MILVLPKRCCLKMILKNHERQHLFLIQKWTVLVDSGCESSGTMGRFKTAENVKKHELYPKKWYKQ